jgi:hypothetical protein
MAQAREPLRGVVVDLRLVSATLPSDVGWTPSSLPAGAVVPGRGFGVDGGAHVFVGPGRYRRLGLGVTGLVSQGRSTGLAPAPTVTTRLLAAAPHVSMNFGHAPGWSHLSLGVGTAKVTSDYAGGVADPTAWGTTIHYGFGGRWFLRERVALSLDLRFWALTPRPASASGARPSAPATTRFVLGAGLAFR